MVGATMPSSRSLAPAGVDLSEDKRPLIVAVSVMTWILAFTTLMLRIAGRKIKGLNLWLDDWFIIVALVCSSWPLGSSMAESPILTVSQVAALAHVSGMAGYGQSIVFGPISSYRPLVSTDLKKPTPQISYDR